jgi:hypothetical protein
MRYIYLKNLFKFTLADADGKKRKLRLNTAHKSVKAKPEDQRQSYIDRNGSKKWSPIKTRLTAYLGNKCWYTEAELVGADLTVDHYRPKCDYWWLAFDVNNYRIACPFANSPKHNQEHGCAGGKGDNFPLLPPSIRATNKKSLGLEKPVILDPCKQEDCDLLAFQADGRPILNPAYAADAIAARRVTESKVLLNLDHPDFNSKREQLYHDITDDVNTYEALPANSPPRTTISERMKKRLALNAPFSTAARYFFQLHRNLSWVEDVLRNS